MSLIFKEPDNKPVDPKAVRMRVMLLSLPFALMAVFALVLLAHDGLHGGLDRQHAMGLLSAAVVCGGLIALIFGINAKKVAMNAIVVKTDGQKPWLKRKDWADGRISSSLRKAGWLLWIFVGFWCVASAVISLVVVPTQLHQGNRTVLFVLVFPVIGLGMIYFALVTTRAWRTFARSRFTMDSFPAASGGTLQGRIQVQARLQPQHGWHLRLSCVRRTTTGASNNRQAVEKILWQDEKWLRADLPQTVRNETGIPVFFKLPADLPESIPATGDGIHWKLEASATLRGPDYLAVFEVPVFKLPEPPQVSEDPTVQFQMTLDEARKQIQSKIQVNDLPDGGREFVFPAGRNPGFASGAALICLIWTGIVALLVWNHAPLPSILVFGAMDLLMGVFVIDLWFRSSRVVVNPGGVMVQKVWLVFRKEHFLKASEIKNIAFEIGATTGHSAYHDLKVQARDGTELLLAKHLNSKAEAGWLAQRMIAALGRPA